MVSRTPNDNMKRIFRVPLLPPRKDSAHKGDLGTVAVVAGSRTMAGAAVLCATAALRAGAGLVRAVVPPELLPVLAAACPCATTVPRAEDQDGPPGEVGAASAWVIGPGLAVSPATRRLVLGCLATVAAPIVLDADGLNVLQADLAPLRDRSAPTVITPHPGEAGRLLARGSSDVQADRFAAAAALARLSGAVVCLKGAGTIVVDRDRFYVNRTGNPGMATGGTGDVLAGVIAGLLAAGMDPFDAAVLGVHAHGIAGDLAARAGSRTGLIASDLLAHLPVAWRRFERREARLRPVRAKRR
jgi:NAD(P)H-hydrate epimerase